MELKANGTIDDQRKSCGVDDCCLRLEFVAKKHDLEKLILACDSSNKMETQRRKIALLQLFLRPDARFSEQDCRSLGDAVFAFQCPADTVILTTNTIDHKPLAEALGKEAQSP